MFAVGHISLAYLLGKGSSKFLKVSPNIPALILMSILPDIDIAVGTLTGTSIHHGPTHSVIFALLFFTPFFILYNKRAIPYFIAYVSHFLLADFFIGGQLQLLWPLSSNTFGFHQLGFTYIGLSDPLNLVAELSMFTAALIVMAKTQDFKIFFKNNKTNLVLLIPMATLLMSIFTSYPFTMPLFRVLPLISMAHLFFLVLFTIPILIIIYTTLQLQLKRSFKNE
ncbi:MAG: metal-dependent hydrolase [Candidatus Bathyarchaeota archaeon]|nr:metal-dependent hydrolase [Candidatus Termiticorpusculum sp.]